MYRFKFIAHILAWEVFYIFEKISADQKRSRLIQGITSYKFLWVSIYPRIFH